MPDEVSVVRFLWMTQRRESSDAERRAVVSATPYISDNAELEINIKSIITALTLLIFLSLNNFSQEPDYLIQDAAYEDMTSRGKWNTS